MKKIISFVFAAVAVVFMQLSFSASVEAARVAVIPIDINVDKVERAGDFNNYYWDIIVEKFQYPDYELIEDEKVLEVLPEGELKSFDQAALAEICDKTDAEIVVAMRLDDVHDRTLGIRLETMLECNMRGEFAGYNRITGKYYHKKMRYQEEIEELLTIKNDWQQEAFASNLKRYINRTIEDKSGSKRAKI